MKAGIGLTVGLLLKLDIGRKSTENPGRESRIKFKVPMFYPMHRYPSDAPGEPYPVHQGGRPPSITKCNLS